MTAYTREELAAAVGSSRSWRGVLRALGRSETSAGTFRAVRRQVDALGIDHAHFTGQRRWSDSQLAEAVASSGSCARCWPGSVCPTAAEICPQSGATPLGCRWTSPGSTPDPFPVFRPFDAPADPKQLRRAGAMLAAAWFTLHGYAISWPLEPCRYDLLAGMCRRHDATYPGEDHTHSRSRSPLVGVSASRHRGRAVYLPDEIDYFFILTGELDAYLIPIDAVLGMPQLSLARYASMRVAQGGQWLDVPVSADASP